MPVGTKGMFEPQKIGRKLINALNKNIAVVDEKDREFVESLGEQKQNFTPKQLSYIVGDEKGMTPRGLASIRKRYGANVDLDITPVELTDENKAQIDAMHVDELENLLDEAYINNNSDIEEMLFDPKVAYMRKSWLERS